MIPVTTFPGRDVAVFGLGLSGIAAAHALATGGARVFAWDDTQASRDKAAAQGVPLHDLSGAEQRPRFSRSLQSGIVNQLNEAPDNEEDGPIAGNARPYRNFVP